jgi:hypothetical protein
MAPYKPKNPIGYNCVNVLVQRAIGKVKTMAKSRFRAAKHYDTNKTHHLTQRKTRYANNKAQELQKMKEYNIKTNTKRCKQKKKYREQHRPQRNAHTKQRRKIDEDFRLTERARGVIGRLKQRNDGKRDGRTFDMVGKPAYELKQYLVSQIAGESQQNLSNYELDHIFPITKYKNTNDAKERRIMHWSNLQPLSKNENANKKDRLPTKAMAAKVERWAWPDGITEADLPDIYPGWSTPLRM